MHKDTQRVLRQLEQELLAEEEKHVPAEHNGTNNGTKPEMFDQDAPATVFQNSEEADIQEIDRVIQPELRKKPRNTDKADCDLESYSEEVWEASADQEGSLRGLVILAVCLTIGIVALVCWWVIKLAGGGL